MSNDSNFRHTGQVWSRSAQSRAQIVRRVCEKLEATYGRPRHGNPTDPLEDLVYVILSNRTPLRTARTVYEALRERFPSWGAVLDADYDEVFGVLRPAGFGKKRTEQIRALLLRIDADFDGFDDDALWKMEGNALLNYLTSLQGVSSKVARCVMMYTLHHEVLPVDIHTHRIASRLGWTKRRRPTQSHDELEAIVLPHRRYTFHVCCVAHGRELCTASKPACPPCPLKRYCRYYKEEVEA